MYSSMLKNGGSVRTRKPGKAHSRTLFAVWVRKRPGLDNVTVHEFMTYTGAVEAQIPNSPF